MSASDHGQNTAYFLGVEGEQTGPFSEADLRSQISQGTLSPDTLIWWEGQSDWQRIGDISKFKSLFESPVQPAPSKAPMVRTTPELEEYTVGGSHPTLDWIATFARTGKEPTPIYDSKESYFKHEKAIPVKSAVLALAVCLVGFGVWAVFKFSATSERKTTKKQAVPKDQALQKRRQLLAQATSQLLLNPTTSIQQLNDLINQNSKDNEGKEAAEVLLNYYRQNKQLESAGDLLSKLERYSEAAKAYSSDPKLVAKTEPALFKAFQGTTGKDSADFLLEDIRLLIKPLDKLDVAKERIALFEKTFPGLTHPFSYYQIPMDQQITNIFTRLSSAFVGMLTKHISEEFPQITLASRPLVEIKRNSAGGLRIIGRYSGDLILRTDRMKGIFFLYWLVDNQWLLVDTNLTTDRQRFAAATRKKYESVVLQPGQMLSFLEGQFRQLYPNQGLHELVSAGDR
ncbi:MAG: DUF4339 domain-containing protein [Proteobacteria bacterium]|nr:DUF4339 domain-containing protein [Pseudomonadota bacterium]